MRSDGDAIDRVAVALALVDVESYVQQAMYVCCCMGVNDRAVRRAIEDGACTVEQVAACTKAGTRCGACRKDIAAMLSAASLETSSAAAPREVRRLDVVPSAA
jgi:bacterioferritin-associated ferredoxin